jgi:MinD-like ATPase involved in chromosome partitioning or flagellar assembly
MNERDEFLRDRLRPGQPGAPTARPPGAPSRDSRTAPPAAFAPVSARPAEPRRAAPAPPAPPRQHAPAPPAPPQSAVPPPPGPWADPSVAPASTPATQPPDRGWRRIVRMATFGLVKLGPSAAQLREAQFEAAIRTVLHGNYKVGVLGKGGVGKTSVAASVGSLFAELRRQDRTVAIDADTAFGRLSSRIDPLTTGSFWELTADKNLRSFTDVVARVGRNSAGLHVLGGEPASGPRRVLDPAIYREAAFRLDRHFTISIIDCGSTMDAPVTQEVLRDLDALIVVSSPWADGASAAAKTMEWLSDRGLTGLLQNSIVVLNDSDGHADKRTRSLLAREFVDHGQPVVEVPFDPHLRPGGVIDVNHEMAPATRRKFLEVTAAIAGYFASQPDGARDRTAR